MRASLLRCSPSMLKKHLQRSSAMPTATEIAKSKTEITQALETPAMKIQVARDLASRAQPYISRAIYALVPVEAIGIGTYATDPHYRLYYDPENVKAESLPTIAATLIHEVGHLLAKHHKRGKNLPEELRGVWNVAGDCEINDDLCRDAEAVSQLLETPADLFVVPQKFGLQDGLLL